MDTIKIDLKQGRRKAVVKLATSGACRGRLVVTSVVFAGLLFSAPQIAMAEEQEASQGPTVSSANQQIAVVEQASVPATSTGSNDASAGTTPAVHEESQHMSTATAPTQGLVASTADEANPGEKSATTETSQSSGSSESTQVSSSSQPTAESTGDTVNEPAAPAEAKTAQTATPSVAQQARATVAASGATQTKSQEFTWGDEDWGCKCTLDDSGNLIIGPGYLAYRQHNAVGIHMDDWTSKLKWVDDGMGHFNWESVRTVRFEKGVVLPPDAESLFEYSPNIVSIDMSNADTSKVKNFRWMFAYCTGLKELKLPEGFDTSSATDIGGMFYHCESLKELKLPTTFKTEMCDSFDSTFDHMDSLQELDLPEGFSTKNAGTIWDIFGDNPQLKAIYIPAAFFDFSHFNSMGGNLAQRHHSGLQNPAKTETYSGKWVRDDYSLPGMTTNEIFEGSSSLAGRWIWQKYANVTFDMAGHGDQVAPAKVGLGDSASSAKPADPTAAGYDFLGWTLNGKAFDFSSAVKGDLALTANWKEQAYKLTYDPAGGSFADGSTNARSESYGKVTGETKVTEAPTREGYDFVGWSCNGKTYLPGDTYDAKDGDGLFADGTLTAVWKKREQKPIPVPGGKETPTSQTGATAKPTTNNAAAVAKGKVVANKAKAEAKSPLPQTGDNLAIPTFPALLGLGVASLGAFLRKRLS